MPKYTFQCSSCNTKSVEYTSHVVEELGCESCDGKMLRTLPTISGYEVKELVDTLTNVSWKQEQDELVKQRKDDFYWTKEVPRLVQQYSVETCLEQGWLVYNDKGELVINKPPSKR
jgi:hypothetical protein